jgi:SOS response regulatory protein OraA/RecX
MLTRRDYTVFEIKQKLKLYSNFEESDFIQAIEWIKGLGYLADETILAERWVQEWRRAGRGGWRRDSCNGGKRAHRLGENIR